MRKKLFLLFAGLCVLANLNAQDKEFWFSASDVAVTHGDAPMFFVFTNPGRIDAQVTPDHLLILPLLRLMRVVIKNGILQVEGQHRQKVYSRHLPTKPARFPTTVFILHQLRKFWHTIW